MKQFAFFNAIVVLLCGTPFLRGAELQSPIPITVDGEPLDVAHLGHAAAFAGDFDGDGRKDLLVGEFYKGRLRIYRNMGTNVDPRFEGFTIFHDGKPEGRIHAS
jgi:hypothetical protein